MQNNVLHNGTTISYVSRHDGLSTALSILYFAVVTVLRSTVPYLMVPVLNPVRRDLDQNKLVVELGVWIQVHRLHP